MSHPNRPISIRRREDAVRRALVKSGYSLRKSRASYANGWDPGYAIIQDDINGVVFGYSTGGIRGGTASLEEVETWARGE